MGLLDIIYTVCAIIGVPGSIYAIKLIRDDLAGESKRSAAQSAAMAAEIMRAIGQTDEDRVLLQYDPDNVVMSGTFENAVEEFVKAYPFKTDTEVMIYRPSLVLTRDDNMLFSTTMHAIILAVSAVILLTAVVIMEIAFRNQPHVQTSWLSSLFATFFIASVVFAFAAAAYLCLRAANRYRAARDAIQAYLDYLRTHEIRIQPEFTQSRRMHDFDCASANRPRASLAEGRMRD